MCPLILSDQSSKNQKQHEYTTSRYTEEEVSGSLFGGTNKIGLVQNMVTQDIMAKNLLLVVSSLLPNGHSRPLNTHTGYGHIIIMIRTSS